MTNPTRPYHSPRRSEAAAQTRVAILAAAHRLFLAHGYGRVTVAQIAAEAGTAAKTVYTSVGSKSEILDLLMDRAVAESNHEEAITRVRSTRTSAEALRELARSTRSGNEGGRESLAILRRAVATHDGVDELWERIQSTYRAALHDAAAHLEAIGALPATLGTRRAADLLWLWFGPESWRVLVEECGWPWDEAESWLYRCALAGLNG